jgi:hypothetical protein
MLPSSAPAVGTVFDSTAALPVNLFATFSLTTCALTCYQYVLEALN